MDSFDFSLLLESIYGNSGAMETDILQMHLPPTIFIMNRPFQPNYLSILLNGSGNINYLTSSSSSESNHCKNIE